MGDGGLALAQWADEVANTHLTLGTGSQDAQGTEPDGSARAVKPRTRSLASLASKGEASTDGQHSGTPTATSITALRLAMGESLLTIVNVSTTMNVSIAVDHTRRLASIPCTAGSQRGGHRGRS